MCLKHIFTCTCHFHITCRYTCSFGNFNIVVEISTWNYDTISGEGFYKINNKLTTPSKKKDPKFDTRLFVIHTNQPNITILRLINSSPQDCLQIYEWAVHCQNIFSSSQTILTDKYIKGQEICWSTTSGMPWQGTDSGLDLDHASQNLSLMGF